YTGMLFWALVSTMFLLRGLRSAKGSNWVAYGITAALGAYTHLTMVFVVVSHAAICAWLLLFPAKKGSFRLRNWKQPAAGIGLSGLLTLLLYAPVLLQVQQFFNKPSKLEKVSTPAWAFWETLRGLSAGLSAGVGAGLLVAGALFAAGLWSFWRQERVVAALFVVPGLATLSGALLARGTMYPRFYFYLLGFGVLILVRGAMASAAALVESMSKAPDKRAKGMAWGTALVALMIVASGVSLVRNYRYPKQDFTGAMRFVDAQRNQNEPVLTAGQASFPYLVYYGRNWQSVESVEQLESVRGRGQRVWLLYTFPIYVEHSSPELMAAIRRDCTTKDVFPGTIGGGDIVVCRIEARR
ncbi:MAG TPA: hypothetical protein VGQ11_01040, partial [Candidatus Acidoferrales bacterium]|nr:hypothetical protein [Candidatus Acidoferrales bacterium]